MVAEDKLDEFIEDVHKKLLDVEKGISLVSDIAKYGTIQLVYVPDVDKSKTFDMHYALENIAEVKAKFIHGKGGDEITAGASGETEGATGLRSMFTGLKVRTTHSQSLHGKDGYERL